MFCSLHISRVVVAFFIGPKLHMNDDLSGIMERNSLQKIINHCKLEKLLLSSFKRQFCNVTYNAGHKCWDTYQNTSEQSPPPPSPKQC